MLVRIANREDPDQIELGAGSESKQFDTLIVLPKEFLQKVNFDVRRGLTKLPQHAKSLFRIAKLIVKNILMTIQTLYQLYQI